LAKSEWESLPKQSARRRDQYNTSEIRGGCHTRRVLGKVVII
jgi:hypothetical protein